MAQDLDYDSEEAAPIEQIKCQTQETSSQQSNWLIKHRHLLEQLN